tara:strand:- start:2946 stop:3104 length:159 start_codon:yes stop_codon:yes gene_type:complete
MENLKKIVFDITESETIRGLANKCKTEKQLLKLIQNLKIGKALKNKFKNGAE